LRNGKSRNMIPIRPTLLLIISLFFTCSYPVFSQSRAKRTSSNIPSPLYETQARITSDGELVRGAGISFKVFGPKEVILGEPEEYVIEVRPGVAWTTREGAMGKPKNILGQGMSQVLVFANNKDVTLSDVRLEVDGREWIDLVVLALLTQTFPGSDLVLGVKDIPLFLSKLMLRTFQKAAKVRQTKELTSNTIGNSPYLGGLHEIEMIQASIGGNRLTDIVDAVKVKLKFKATFNKAGENTLLVVPDIRADALGVPSSRGPMGKITTGIPVLFEYRENITIQVVVAELGVPPTGSIAGIVTDTDGNPIGGADVAFTGTSVAPVTTGADGQFAATGLPVGLTTVSASKEGFKPEENNITIDRKKVADFAFMLESKKSTTVRLTKGNIPGLTYISTYKQGYKEFRNERDGSVMVLIPAGEFTMGSDEGGSDEKPKHDVYLDAYYIDKYEVTVGQFRKFCSATRTNMPGQPSWNEGDNYPVVNVSWDDASAYASWAGKRLPTEAEWEKAARGLNGRVYPWGYTWDSSKCNNGEPNSTDGYANTAPVGSFPQGASKYGVLDMAGNVWEWCSDWYNEIYYQSSPSRNPTGPSSGLVRVGRGGSWNSGLALCRTVNRGSYLPELRTIYYGFRCAR